MRVTTYLGLVPSHAKQTEPGVILRLAMLLVSFQNIFDMNKFVGNANLYLIAIFVVFALILRVKSSMTLPLIMQLYSVQDNTIENHSLIFCLELLT